MIKKYAMAAYHTGYSGRTCSSVMFTHFCSWYERRNLWCFRNVFFEQLCPLGLLGVVRKFSLKLALFNLNLSLSQTKIYIIQK